MTRLPFPAIGGDKVRADFFVQRLARHYDVHLVALSDRPVDAPAEAYLQRHCASHRVFVVPRWRHLLATVIGLLDGRPLQVAYYHLREVERYVRNLEPEVDLGLAVGQRAAAYLFAFGKPRFLEMTDSQTLICRRGATMDRSWRWRLIHRIEAPRIERFERDCLTRFRTTFFVNRDEEQFYGRPDRTAWVPNAVNEAFVARPRPAVTERAICFLGRLDYQPNADAIAWFGAHVLPLLPRDVLWYVIGPWATPSTLALEDRHPNVRVTGFLDDPWIKVAACACLVAPMQTGGGSQYKVIEAMALGVPVVTTHHGAVPILGAADGVHLMIADDPADMAQRIMALLSDPARAAAIGANARELVRARYTWDAIELQIVTILEAGAHEASADAAPVPRAHSGGAL